ncbi:hypothetical protein GUITHDRAFT_137540 [Guillardia theta CCMP2712]|uniref:Uncharacterized protein n=1 Tax=Guillardia theta (strain CCMP2712) TaxID=905079 RepID=L1JFS5_GUITC|nr:hypothetical protein GUITHDRAFT_137540 [Guillardia theta CCMP2712]EKX47363.1 hypothetical protein GUITHDRAFT_137540 [Guillardia theta CCMP2712]|eukprot:XP_005834343.1 hypothetical protein GUITHDRAFT_137540 [Guillardia theta CCMP2712]
MEADAQVGDKKTLSSYERGKAIQEISLFGESVKLRTDDYVGEGGCVWSAGTRLSQFLTETGISLQDRNVLELGSGTGALAIALGLHGARVVATDVPWVLPLLQENVEKNSHQFQRESQVVVKELNWDQVENFDLSNLTVIDYVIACECIYSLEEGGLAETFGFKTDATTERLLKLPWAASDVKSQTILVLCGKGKQLLIVNRIRSSNNLERQFVLQLSLHFNLECMIDTGKTMSRFNITSLEDIELSKGSILFVHGCRI